MELGDGQHRSVTAYNEAQALCGQLSVLYLEALWVIHVPVSTCCRPRAASLARAVAQQVAEGG